MEENRELQTAWEFVEKTVKSVLLTSGFSGLMSLHRLMSLRSPTHESTTHSIIDTDRKTIN